jgi:hypothetical protein
MKSSHRELYDQQGNINRRNKIGRELRQKKNKIGRENFKIEQLK